VYAWQGQVETAAFISSPIPTTTAAVTRNADVLTYPSAGNISGTIGTAYAEVSYSSLLGTGNHITIGDSVENRNFINMIAPTTVRFYDGTTVDDWTVSSVAVNTLTKHAVKWSGVVVSIAINGVAGSPATKVFDGDMNVTAIAVGTTAPYNEVAFSNIRNVRIWSQTLPDATMEAMTTP